MLGDALILWLPQAERLVTKGYSLEYIRTGHYMLSMSVHLHTVPRSVIILLSLKLLCPCSLFVWMVWWLNAISQSHTSLMSCKLRVSKYVNPVTSLYQAIMIGLACSGSSVRPNIA